MSAGSVAARVIPWTVALWALSEVTLAVALAGGVPWAALFYRIRVEERVLAAAFGDAWVRHRASTWRLVPWIW